MIWENTTHLAGRIPKQRSKCWTFSTVRSKQIAIPLAKISSFHLFPVNTPTIKNPHDLHYKSIEWPPYDKIMDHQQVNPFHAICSFLYTLKTKKRLGFPGVFRGYRISPKAWNALNSFVCSFLFSGLLTECSSSNVTAIFIDSSMLFYFWATTIFTDLLGLEAITKFLETFAIDRFRKLIFSFYINMT